MATVLFSVKATITKDREDDFNRWYNREHCPQFLRYPGAVSARRYRAIDGEDEYLSQDQFRYLALYEIQDEDTFRRFLRSDSSQALRQEYTKHFGDVSQRIRSAYTQVWP